MKSFALIAAIAACITLPASATAAQLGSLNFTNCEIGSGASRSKAECAYLSVPEDYARPEGRKIKLHLALISSSARKVADDPVVFLAGGPGQAASDGYGSLAPGFKDILEKRHVILIDQRGTGLSHPLKCNTDEVLDPMLVPTPDMYADFAKACLAKLDADPRFYTTTVATKDLESMRIALSAPSLNLVGFSYGTRVAQHYAMWYPKTTRSLILDGVAPNSLVLGSEHARALDDALAAQFKRCKADVACFSRFGDPAATLQALKTQLAEPRQISINDPLSGKPRQVQLGLGALAGMARFYAYQSEMVALVPLLMDEAKNGRPEPMLAQGEMAGKNLGEMINHGMQLSVSCSEDADLLKADPDDAQRLLGNQLIEALAPQCAVWPKGERPKDFFEPLKSDIPTLIISGEFDPVTPARYGEEVIKTLSNAVHIQAPAQGHVNLARGCIGKLAGQFLRELAPKKLDTKCVQKIQPAPFFLEFTGPSP